MILTGEKVFLQTNNAWVVNDILEVVKPVCNYMGDKTSYYSAPGCYITGIYWK